MMENLPRKGDLGLSSLIKGGLISKGDPVFELLGTVDELNSFIGLAICSIPDKKIKNDLIKIQNTLSKMMGHIAGVKYTSKDKYEISERLNWLEEKIALFERSNNIPSEFSFPGKSEVGARLDICRTFTRRVERALLPKIKGTNSPFHDYFPFLNRLSSFFFVLRMKLEN